MDSFLRLYAIYRSITRWQIVVRVYAKSELMWKIIMWTAKLAFAALAVMGLFASSWHPFFLAAIVAAMAWMWSFSKARAIVFSEVYQFYPERIKYFGKNYQYLRYLAFMEKLKSNQFSGNVLDALAFIDGQIETDSHTSISSHPFITFSMGAILAVLGGAAGQWRAEYVAIAILSMGTIAYFSYMILDITRTPQSDLKEFKRFLFWAKDEQPTEA